MGNTPNRRVVATAMSHIYIHVPYCLKKCHYCAFYSRPQPTQDQLDCYVDTLLLEAGRSTFQWNGVETLFLGGGTPTLLGPHRVKRLLDSLPLSSSWLPGAEVSMEANPGTVGPWDLEFYRAAGINRLSIGVQSLNEQTLSFLGRLHDANDALRVVRHSASLGFRTSVDLIYGVPGQELIHWFQEAQTLAELGASHISAYLLSAEPETPLGRSTRQGLVVLPDEEAQADLVRSVHDFFRRLGWDLYEVSSAASTTGQRCLHNLAYWAREPYLGLGPGAHSFDGVRRWANIGNDEAWLDAVKKGKSALEFLETLTPSEELTELIMLAMRCADGLPLSKILDRPEVQAQQFLSNAQRLAQMGLAQLIDGRLVPTAEGLLFADSMPQWLLDQ